jgi:hypothetical protein
MVGDRVVNSLQRGGRIVRVRKVRPDAQRTIAADGNELALQGRGQRRSRRLAIPRRIG